MPGWTFLAYIPDGETVAPIRSWYISQDIKIRSAFDAVLIDLAGVDDWEKADEFKALERTELGLGQISFEIEIQEGKQRKKRQIRVVGVWPPDDPKKFLMIFGFEKAGRGAQVPPNALATAMKYLRQCKQKRGKSEHYFG